MAKISKRFKAMTAVEAGRQYPVDAALKIIRDNAKTKFVESVDVAIRLGIDAKKSDQGVRGSTMLPHGTGKTVRVAVFCPAGEKAEAARAAGADAVGMEDLAEKMQAGELNFGRVIATPDAMRVVGKLGQLLGPRGLMPNPKDGSVTADVVSAVKNAKAGQVKFRNDKAGIVHCSIGKVNFEPDALKDNLNALLADLMKAKPSTSKGVYLQKVSLSSTMGLGVAVDPSSLILK
ncbi:MAG: 50S ribosomal protein L1 [Xanthomonadaceae bacterium]|nr:50S ribosomal protein L1 [Xanthomonadaceae bacterium]MDE1959479.1 50S ribosomal protein L1 [Xanthomonadaceae bacterium]